MKWRTEKTPVSILIFLTGLAVLAILLAQKSVVLVKQPFYEEKIQAAKTMLSAMSAVKNEKIARKVAFDPTNDPYDTGLIGSDFTSITTDRGSLNAKLAATNPNFAAVVVAMLAKAKVRRGDIVAVAMTGSFPAMNIAVLAAIQSLGLKPIVISSVGSSSWGANDPQLTWLDMERILNEKGILKYRSVAATVGGGKDIGQGLSPLGRRMILKAIQRNHISLLQEPLLENDIQERMKIYEREANGKRIKVYINVGGGMASLGSRVNGDLFPPGYSKNFNSHGFTTKGTMILMSEQGIPIIHLLKIPKIAKHYNLVIDASPLNEMGRGSMYLKERYDRFRLVLITLFLVMATLLTIRVNLFHYLMELRQIRSIRVNPGTSFIPTDKPSQDKSDRRKE